MRMILFGLQTIMDVSETPLVRYINIGVRIIKFLDIYQFYDRLMFFRLTNN